MGMITGGELLIRTLKQAGVTTVFGLHGAHLETLFQSCLDHRISIIDTRSETAAGYAAEAYARTTRKLGVAIVTAGPGFTNAISSIANAYLDRTPVLYLSGASALGSAETNNLQAGIDQTAIVKPITKWAHQITVTRDIPRLVAMAVRLATSGPTGPVLLDLPQDVLGAQIDEATVTVPARIVPDFRPAPSVDATDSALELLSRAHRPVIVAGHGAAQSGCEDDLIHFVEESGIPVYSDFFAHGLLPSSHPLYGGTTHKMSDLTDATGRPDVVVALGLRFGLFTLGASDRLIPQAAKLIHIEMDPKEINRLRPADIGIVADCREMLSQMRAQMPGHRWPDWTKWQRTIASAKIDRKKRAAEDLARPSPPIHPYFAVTAIADSLPKDTVVIGDGAEAYHWFNEVVRQETPRSYITHGFLGDVGFGMGLSVGAQVAHPNRRVLCLAGDGAVGFNITEFDTMVRHKLPIVVVVMNNRSWAASQHFQEMVSGANRVTGTQLGGARYDEVAKGFGAFGAYVTKAEDLAPALQAAFESGRPACVNIEIDVKPLPPELHLLMSR